MKLGAGEIIARVLAFVGSVYLARALGAEMYGIVGVALAVLYYFVRLTDAGLDLVGMRELATDRPNATRVVHSVLGFRVALSLVLAGLLAAGALYWLPSPDGEVLAGFALTLIPVGASTRFVHLGFERGGYAATARVLGEAVILLLLVIVVRSPDDVLRVPLVQLSGLGVAAVVLAWWMRGYGIPVRLKMDWAVLMPLLRRSVHVVAAALLGLIAYNSDLIILRFTHGAELAGYYAAAYMPLSLALNLGIAYRHSILPALSRLSVAPERQAALYHTGVAQVFAVVTPTAIGGMLLAPAVIAFAFGAEYEPAGPILQLLIWAIPLAQLREPAIAAILAARREHRLLQQNAIGTAVNLSLNFALIPRYGMFGAAIATVATEVVRLALALWFARKEGFLLTRAGRFWKVIFASAVMSAVILALRSAPFPISLAAAAVSYVLALYLVGGITFRRRELPALTV
ncbi:MAG TPA: flippase [Gemmatimonadaceae bacterium]|nr:flippase [Gemmatimonadaceae bacterium]